MKKTFLLLLLTQGALTLIQAQTHYGSFVGTQGTNHSYFGYYAGNAGTSSSDQNSFFGSRSGQHTTGFHNTGIGSGTLHWNTTGIGNTAVGAFSLGSNTTGVLNTATGVFALDANTTGSYNVANGHSALRLNSTGRENTAHGYSSLYQNEGNYNTATGSNSMHKNVGGSYNTANGYLSLNTNQSGWGNTAIGSSSLYTNDNGGYNTAIGFKALLVNTAWRNTAVGSFCMNQNVSGTYNTALGYYAGPTQTNLSNTTAIGYLTVPTASNQVRIGNTAVASIGGQVSWTTFSDGRFKKDIKEDVSGLDFINYLRPVSYVVDKPAVNKFLHVTDSSDNQTQARSIQMRQTGFVAQEVEAIVKKTGYVFYGVDAPKNENDHYGIRYAEFVVPLVKAVQELSTKAHELSIRVEEQQEQIQLLLAQLDSKSGINKSEVNGNTNTALLQNNPNPFDAETEIRMTLPENVSHATIMIYNLEGKQMKNMEVQDRGDVSIKISANELAAGMYLYTLIADGQVLGTKRMILTQ